MEGQTFRCLPGGNKVTKSAGTRAMDGVAGEENPSTRNMAEYLKVLAQKAGADRVRPAQRKEAECERS